jgi:hypothetical protein
MKAPVVNLLAIALTVACGGVAAQKQGSDAIVGEKGRDAIVGEKREARPAAALPPEVSRMMQRSGVAVRFRAPALKLQQLPPEVLAAQPTAQDLGAPFRFDPSANPAGDRRWYVVNAAEMGSGQDNVGLLSDSSAPRLAGKFGLTFRVEPGFRYLVDCAVVHAWEMAVSHTGFGQTANEVRMPVNSGFVSLVSPPVRSGGTAWIEFKAMRAQGAAWRWRGCEVTPLRSSA